MPLAYSLDTETQRVSKLRDIPAGMLAHQVIYIPGKADSEAPEGTVYLFGGMSSMMFFQPKNFKYNVALDKYDALPDWPEDMYRISFNLLPILNNELILVISQDKHLLFDVGSEKFIPVVKKGHKQCLGVQIGAFTLPLGTSIPKKRSDSCPVEDSELVELQKSESAPDKEQQDEDDDEDSMQEYPENDDDWSSDDTDGLYEDEPVEKKKEKAAPA